MMATKTINQGSVPRRGLFLPALSIQRLVLFAGRFTHAAPHKKQYRDCIAYAKLIFWLSAFHCYLFVFSALWLPVAKAFTRLLLLRHLLSLPVLFSCLKRFVRTVEILASLDKPVRWFGTMALIAFCIKVLLQMCSAIPSLNMITYGFRPIVIGYLHLVLLGMLSIFLTGYFLSVCRINYSGMLIKGLIIL